MAFNGLNTFTMSFNHVRVPRESLMPGVASGHDHDYTSGGMLSGKRGKFLAVRQCVHIL